MTVSAILTPSAPYIYRKWQTNYEHGLRFVPLECNYLILHCSSQGCTDLTRPLLASVISAYTEARGCCSSQPADQQEEIQREPSSQRKLQLRLNGCDMREDEGQIASVVNTAGSQRGFGRRVN